MSKSLLVFGLICLLGIGAVLVYAKNNVQVQTSDSNTQELSQDIPKQEGSDIFGEQVQISPSQTMPEVTELQIEDIKVGNGEAVKDGDTAEVNYVGALLNGTKFDSSYDRRQTFSFTVGAGEVIEGWDKGLLGMKPGGKRKLIIPSDMGYGPSGNGPIPPNSPLYFEIELVSIKPSQ
jgi:FKBP-type peptidyl-prolyl cis-trans isomerase